MVLESTNFLCAACPGPVDNLPSFPTFSQVILHSLQAHKVTLEWAVQASTVLPTSLIMYKCSLCPADFSCFLTKELLKDHLGNHSNFFVRNWGKFSDVKCRVCEKVVSVDAIDDHMDSDHHRNLFADFEDIIKDDHGKHANIDDEVKENFSILEVSNIGTKSNFKAKSESTSCKTPVPPSKPSIRLKPMNLLLAQKVKQELDTECGELKFDCASVSSCVSSKTVKVSDLNPNQLALNGIKKHISEDNIRKFFSENDTEIIDVRISNGCGSVTFLNEEEACSWNGSVANINDCLIKMWLKNSRKGVVRRSEQLQLKCVPKNISVDDLHDFFWRELVVIDNLKINDGVGYVVFRLKQDADIWDGKTIEVKGARIKLVKHLDPEESISSASVDNRWRIKSTYGSDSDERRYGKTCARKGSRSRERLESERGSFDERYKRKISRFCGRYESDISKFGNICDSKVNLSAGRYDRERIKSRCGERFSYMYKFKTRGGSEA